MMVVIKIINKIMYGRMEKIGSIHKRNLLYFLEKDKTIKSSIQEEINVKKQIYLNMYNSEEKKEKG